jgi:hypothetical protein
MAEKLYLERRSDDGVRGYIDGLKSALRMVSGDATIEEATRSIALTIRGLEELPLEPAQPLDPGLVRLVDELQAEVNRCRAHDLNLDREWCAAKLNNLSSALRSRSGKP